MEHERPNREDKRAKRTLTAIAAIGGIVCVVCASLRGFLGYQIQDYSQPVFSFLGIAMIVGMFVALLAITTRLQVEVDESEYEAVLKDRERS